MSDQPDQFAQILAEIAGLRGDLVGVKTELRDELVGVKTELRDELVGVNTELRHELVGVKTELRHELVGVRSDLMARMDRLQDALTAIRDDIGVNMGRADAAVRAHAGTREDVRGLEEQFGLMWRKIRHLENRVREIGGDP
jgi:hypothetical protein